MASSSAAASKNQIDSSVAERRLRPLYDCLDCGNNKRALQEADKLLKKQPNFQCAKALKCLALLRMGKEKESEELLRTVHDQVPHNEATLQAMSICYRELHKPELICKLYAAAAELQPNSEDLLTHLFMSYVRVGDYKKQQSVAMSLYKLLPKNPYYFWAVMSIVMQARTSKPEVKSSIVLPLAERMVEKFVQFDKIEAEQEVQLYLMILEMQGKLEEALNVIEGPLGEKLQSFVVPNKKVELLIKLKRWGEANVVLKKMLKEEMDCWTYYKDYLESVFHLVEEKGEVAVEGADSSLSDCAGFLSNIQEDNQRSTHRLRGPYLAHLEFYARLRQHGKEHEVHLGDLVELFMLYFHEFGAKQCCLGDLKPYLKLLSSSQAQDFLEQVFELVQLKEGSFPSSLQQMLRYISNLQLTRCFGFHEVLDVTRKLQLVTSLLNCYKESLHFNEGQLSTDFMNNDPYALLNAHILYDIYVETKDAIFLKDACVVLEFALSYSVSNYQIKLLLMKLYNMLGASRLAYKMYELLDIKHMQLDTLGYIHLWPMLSTAQYTQAIQIFNTTLKFFTASCRESADHLTLSYKYGSFLKITEFVDFRDRINNSLHYAFVQVEKSLIEVLQATSHDHTAQMIEQAAAIANRCMDWDALEDNRDFTILWSVNPDHRHLPQQLIDDSFKTEMDLLRLRLLLLQLLSSAMNLSSACKPSLNNSNSINKKSNNTKTTNENNCSSAVVENSTKVAIRTNLEKYLSEFLLLFERLFKHPPARLPLNIIEAPPESRLHDYLSSPLVSLVVNLSRTVLALDSLQKSSNSSDEEQIKTKKRNVKSDEVGDIVVVNGTVSLNGEDFEKLKLDDHSDYVVTSETASTTLLELTNDVFSFAKTNFGDGLNANSLNERLETIQRLTLAVELVCVASVFCGVVHELVKETMAPVVKKNKKKKDNAPVMVTGDPEQKKRAECFESLATSTLKAIKQLDETVEHLKGAWHPSLTNVVTRIDLLEFKHPFCEILNESYISSLSELSSILRRKLRHVDELKL